MNGYHDVNLAMLLQVASRLGVLLDRVVFVGGCTTGLFLTDTAAAPVRPTLDVDLIVEVVSPKDYRDLEKTLRQLGFRQPDDKGSPICRWQIDTIIVDVMPTDESILGFTNRWYAPAIKAAEKVPLNEKMTIRLVRAPYFVATKIEAFYGRGQGDFLISTTSRTSSQWSMAVPSC